MTTPEHRGTKRLLSIGIDAYPLLTPERQLEGCVNDVRLLRQVLLDQFGFAESHATLLTNEDATQAGILAAFDTLVRETQANDIVVIHYAGHGAQMTDLEGDEPSGLDSTIVPTDSSGWSGINRDITDDVIGKKLDALGAKTSFITLIFDCCHSGTITRDVSPRVRARALPPDRRPAEELLKFRTPEPPAAPRTRGPGGWLPITEKYVLISGCRDDETSFEYSPPEGEGRVHHGALTYFLVEQLRKAVPGTTYRDVFERAAARVNGEQATQHPQMEGKADREIFGVRDIEPMRFVRVLTRSGSSVTLSAGAAQGMTAGSTFEVHLQGTKEPAPVSLLGEVQLREVGATSATATILSETADGAITADARAFETEHAYGTFQLAVQLPEDDASGAVAALRAELSRSTLLTLEEAGGSGITGVLIEARDRVSPGDPVPRAGALPEARWCFTSAGGDLVMPLKGVREIAIIRENLEKVARYRHGLAFANPDPNSQMAGRFELEVMRRGSDGEPVPATPDDGGHVVFEEGEPIIFRIASNHSAAAYFTLVDFGLGSEISVIAPGDARSQQQLGAGNQFFIGKAPFPPLEVTWPANFPFADAADRASEGESIETVKLFVTEQEADFSVLRQSAARSASASRSSAIGTLLGAVFQGSTTRQIGKAKSADGDWTTVSASFLLRRKSSRPLASSGKEVALGAATLVTQGMTGTATTRFGAAGHAVDATLLNDPLREALAVSGIDDRQTIEIAGAQEVGPATRSVGGEPAMQLRLADPGPGFGQMVLSVDEAGVVSWHLSPPRVRPAGTRGVALPPAVRTYDIPRSVPEAAPAGTRGVLGVLGKKVLKELVFPLIDPVLGEVGASFVNRMEKARWPYRVRTFAPSDYASDAATPVDGETWTKLSAGRALLFVHGTFSRAHLAFCQLPPEYLAELHTRYDGRVFAFDHFTLSHDPIENVRHLLAAMPAGLALDVDIICHSRGGLVSRILTERQDELAVAGQRVRVGKVVFVGAPNAGTPLADPERMGDLLDVITNLLDVLPDNGVTDVLTMVIGVLKQAAIGTLGGLDGLQSMRPGGAFAKALNAGPRSGDAAYYAITSNATPVEPGLKRLFVRKGLNKIMAGANDFVVPTDGVYKENGSAFFPIKERLLIEGGDAVSHTRYFGDARVQRTILEWLGGAQ